MVAYERESEIARGGMGAVILCNHHTLNRPVAMKVMRDEKAATRDSRTRFLEEARVTGQLEHPNIVPIHELGKDQDGNPYFTMKLVKGKSLAEIIDDISNGHKHKLSELLAIFLKVCDGIAFAHSKAVIHRDLKPANIMVGDFGEVLVMDWGLAKVVGKDSDESATESGIRKAETVKSLRANSDVALTLEGDVSGTPAFMSPEQAEGKIHLLDHRSDIYSLGAILYELLTLEPPVEGKTVHQILLNVADGNVVSPGERTPQRNIQEELSAIAMKAMQKNRLKRYQSVQELSDDINRFLEGRTVTAKDDSVLESVSKLVKRNKGVSVAGTLAFIILMAIWIAFTVDNTHKRQVAERALVQLKNSELQALNAERRQRRTALQASRKFAFEAVRSAEIGRWVEANRRLEDAESVAENSAWHQDGRDIRLNHSGEVSGESCTIPVDRLRRLAVH
ncbi:MAG: serine/threonine-protein kinase [Planctomycetota bacterium]|nr:serine/threonine-protein kinase [Planctomycetota bacterium]